ncbi:hypothetical protein [Pseudodesulfovibrio portus]|jgi:hypothetical protein|uniref:Uncharacterized protein n=1 Tax=Pseudodesulfovibrio portus TaxID=231439 RepID=A0ABM8AQB0_9BACT|nr:hypothetical protein [Pseudodesulfovibrio portus]BDQ33592.1 hypothetical protein JCM14722_11340 [Pseudodesulfovibrio portus]
MKKLFLAVLMVTVLSVTPQAFAYTITLDGNGWANATSWNTTQANTSVSYDWADYVADGKSIPDQAIAGDSMELSGKFTISSSYGNTGQIDTSWGLSWLTSVYATGGLLPGVESHVQLLVKDSSDTQVFNKWFQTEDGDESFAVTSANLNMAPVMLSLNLDEEYSWSLEVGVSGFVEIPNSSLDISGSGEALANFSILTEDVATPIPGAVWLLGSGLVGLIGLRKKLS